MKILAGFTLLLYTVLVPCAVCLMHYRHPDWFSGWKKLLLWTVVSALFSWGFVNAILWIPTWLGLFRPRGPELAFALFLGWLYLWVDSLPVMLLYWIVRGLFLKKHKPQPK